ncbi:Glycosyl transferase, group 1 [Rhodococcus sp. AW25M09]|uniref:glycosyltransferase n=1 Tax=Rhodococcus sp. AW25M09 TaxID=1268303 RepID=UPI0002AC3DDF|nr:glycosyltransferase [Rhodococcus sp. AW25M09]CCQ13661.1 Glycosyl transferase, group 1 [Rhodococcus sp. AW25M09]
MRILHAVTLFSPDGAYGGPVRVALNQASALRESGHEVTLTAGVRGFDPIPTEQEGVPLALKGARNLVPGVGFAGLVAPTSLTWLRKHRAEFDVVHVHLARDLVMLPFAATVHRLGLPFVVQSHGMLAPKSNPLAPALDFLLVRRLLRQAQTVFCLTDQEREGISDVAGDGVNIQMLNNGVPEYEAAESIDAVPEILYLARLHPRKRPLDFVDAAKQILDSGFSARFTLVGPDEGEAEQVAESIASRPEITWEGPLPGGTGPERMRRASIYVLPSVNEPYPMSVLEAMAVGIPVVVTEECGLAALVSRTGCGLVTVPGKGPIAQAMQTLLTDPALARAMGERGRASARSELSMRSVTARLSDTYADAAAQRVRRG